MIHSSVSPPFLWLGCQNPAHPLYGGISLTTLTFSLEKKPKNALSPRSCPSTSRRSPMLRQSVQNVSWETNASGWATALCHLFTAQCCPLLIITFYCSDGPWTGCMRRTGFGAPAMRRRWGSPSANPAEVLGIRGKTSHTSSMAFQDGTIFTVRQKTFMPVCKAAWQLIMTAIVIL